MVKKYFFFTCLVCFHAFSQVSGVGINTENPQQALHLASSTGTIRVDGLNSPNNNFNGGGVNKTFPLFVDSNGDFTLKSGNFQNSDGGDVLTISTPLISTSVSVPTSLSLPNNGVRRTIILPYTINVTRDATLEIKYSVSFEVLSAAGIKIKDAYGRKIDTFYTVDADLSTTPSARRYGQSSKCYFNNNTAGLPVINCAEGVMYNGCSTYVRLTAGSHTIRLYGEVTTGDTNITTLVNFAVGTDSLFMKLY